MATTSRTVFDNIRDIVDKANVTNSLSDNALKEMAYKYINQTAQTYVFDKVMDDGTNELFRWIGSKHLFLYGASFTEGSGSAYVIHANASILVTGNHGADTISVTGTPIRFYALAAEVCMFLASRKAQDGTVAVGTNSISMTSVRAELQDMAAYYSQMDQMYGL